MTDLEFDISEFESVAKKKVAKKTVKHKCKFKGCGKTFFAEKARLKTKHKPKFCTIKCYAASRILPPGEARRRRLKRSKEYYRANPELFKSYNRKKVSEITGSKDVPRQNNRSFE